MDDFWSNISYEYNPMKNEKDKLKPYSTGAVLKARVDEFLQNMNITETDYIVDKMPARCTTAAYVGESAYVVILTWLGSQVLSGVC
jgi:hypothetical protein